MYSALQRGARNGPAQIEFPAISPPVLDRGSKFMRINGTGIHMNFDALFRMLGVFYGRESERQFWRLEPHGFDEAAD